LAIQRHCTCETSEQLIATSFGGLPAIWMTRGLEASGLVMTAGRRVLMAYCSRSVVLSSDHEMRRQREGQQRSARVTKRTDLLHSRPTCPCCAGSSPSGRWSAGPCRSSPGVSRMSGGGNDRRAALPRRTQLPSRQPSANRPQAAAASLRAADVSVREKFRSLRERFRSGFDVCQWQWQ
jgi:hypothetical protein